MNYQIARSKSVMAAVVAIFTFALCASALASPSNKWRLQFSGNAESSGVIVLKLSPVGGEPITVEIQVPDKISENHVAKLVTETLRNELPGDGYHTERDDGEDVLIKAKGGAADFDLIIVSNTVKHVSINPDQE
jgi:hypothetical protein